METFNKYGQPNNIGYYNFKMNNIRRLLAGYIFRSDPWVFENGTDKINVRHYGDLTYLQNWR